MSTVEPETYLHYIRLRSSRSSQNDWAPYDEQARNTALEDFRRLWATNFLEDLSIEVTDFTFSNGVVGKLVTYHLEERARVKLVQYEGSTRIDRTRIDERLRERSIELRLDSFLDQNAVSRIKTVVAELMAEEGFANATVTHSVTSAAGGPKLVNVMFHVDEGPKIVIRDVEFVGNVAFSDDVLAQKLKGNRAQNLLSFATKAGAYKESRFADDARTVEDYYRDQGYVTAQVGQPELRALDDAADSRTRYVQLRIPVTEGARYRIGAIAFDGNKVVPANVLSAIFRLEKGEWYTQERIRNGFERARELYGAAGYMEFTAYPDLRFSDQPSATQSSSSGTSDTSQPPTVDVTMRVSEGAQYRVNRITFSGNTTTRDNVIRRELRLFEGGVFDTEALKLSVRRLNQLGYFKPIEGSDKDVQVEKTADRENVVDVNLKVQEQNRNQIQFGAGVSQYEGVFGNISFTTSNFMGRGESLTLSGQKGARSTAYQVGFAEPYVFDRPITAGADLYSRKIDYLTATDVVGYSEVRGGINLVGGRPVFRFSRATLTYGYEVIHTAVADNLMEDLDAESAVGVPVFNAFLDEGRHVESRLTPAFLHNTVDNPFAPRSGRRLTLSTAFAGGFLGGTTDYLKPEVEVVQYIPHTRRTALGVRATGGWLFPFGRTRVLPYYLRYFLGGETQIRGVDIRTVGPTDSDNRAIGGDKFVLFNAEYYLDVFGPLRLLAFHDAGQAFSETQNIDLRQLRTSSGVEARVTIPMLNVPFRLIYAWNIYRDEFQPPRVFKFSVGATF